MDRSIFSNYTWFELWGPLYLGIAVILFYLYYKKFVRSSIYSATNSQVRYFIWALILFYLVKGTPIAVVADHYLFGAHVLQLSVIFFIVTPLIVLSLPVEYLRQLFWHYKMKYTLKALSHPWVTAIFFNGLLTAYLAPPVFNVLKENMLLLYLAQAVLLIHAFLMWWTIITPLPEISKLENLIKIAYIFFTSILLMPIGFFLLVIQNDYYPFYEAVAGDLFPVLTAIYDQQLAGGVLKVTQLTSYAYALLFITLSWGRAEEAKEGQVEDKNIRVIQGIVIHNPKKD